MIRDLRKDTENSGRESPETREQREMVVGWAVPQFELLALIGIANGMQKLSEAKFANTWRIMCRRCGKLRPSHAFQDVKRVRICNECFHPPTGPTLDLVNHVQQFFAKKPGKT